MAKRIIFSLFPILLIILLSFFAWRPLIEKSFFTHHDDQQVARLFQLDRALYDGQFPARIVSDLGFGLGYAVFNFYPPFTYYLGEIFHLWGSSFLDSIKFVWLVAILGSGISMFFLGRRLFGTLGGIIAALFYVYAPYHAVDAYVRGALAELFSFVWLPLILLCTYKNKPVIAGILLALLMITHNLIFLPFYGFVVIWTYLTVKKSFIHNTLYIILYTVLAFGLTAFFWAPALWEKQFTLVDQALTTNLASYKIHFVCLSQLWDSAWGYGGSIAGCVDGMSFKLGKLHIMVSFLALIVAFIKRSKIHFSLFMLLFLSVFMTTEYSSFIWDRLPVLWYLQFPWRFLEFAALFSSLLAGSLFVIASNAKQSSLIAIILIILLLFFNIKLFVPQHYNDVSDVQLTSDFEIKNRVSSTSFEYLPKGSPASAKEYYVSSIKYYVLQGDFKESSQEFRSNSFVISGISKQGAQLQINVANFVGWKVWVNNDLAKISDDNKYKLISVNIPAGSIKIMGRFEDTPVRTVGNIISIIFICGLAIYGYKRNKK